LLTTWAGITNSDDYELPVIDMKKEPNALTHAEGEPNFLTELHHILQQINLATGIPDMLIMEPRV